MKAVILAAGMASRLRPLTNDRPKCLLRVGRRYLLERTIDSLVNAGITQYVIVTGYRGDMIRCFLTEKYPRLDIFFIDNKDFQTTNNIYSLWLTHPQVNGEDFILLDSDILFDGRVINRLLGHKDSVLAVNSHELGDEEIKVITDADGYVKEISKTCDITAAIGESVGIEKMTAEYSQSLFLELEQMIESEGLSNVFYERAFERLIPQGHQFSVVDTTDLFSIELDTVEDFNKASELIPEELF